MKKRMYSKTIFFLMVGSILLLGVPAVLSDGCSYSKDYEYETYDYNDKVDYETYEYTDYEKYDYSDDYSTYYDSYEYKDYEYETYDYYDKVDYETYNNQYVKYDYTDSYYSYNDYYKYKDYDYVLQSFLYRIFERFPILENLFFRFF